MPSSDQPIVGNSILSFNLSNTVNNTSTNTPKTPKKPKSANRGLDLSTQPFKVAHQKINLDVDLLNTQIQGFTELTIVPTERKLDLIKLDCRNLQINKVTLSTDTLHERKLTFKYDDKINVNDETDESNGFFGLYSDYISIHQHHWLSNRLDYLFNETDTEELAILLPDKLKLTANSATPSFTPRTPQTSNLAENAYSPIYLKIEYSLKNPKNGLVFRSGIRSANPKKDWHAYTTNSDYNISTSSWVPCMDNLWERSTWQLELSIPRTIKDIGNSKLLGSAEAETALDNQDEEEDDDNYELMVVTGDVSNLKEVPHDRDMSKKVVSWSMFNPVCSHHVGWAVGPFNATTLPSLSDEEGELNEDERDTNTVPCLIYSLPDQSDAAMNTCIFMDKAMDFYVREFASYPFNSFCIVFVEDCISDCSFAGLSVFSDKLLYTPDLVEPMFNNTPILLQSLSNQWSGVYVVPQTFQDIWCTIGISHYMALQFIKKLMGSNEFKFRVKKQSDEIVNEDVGKRPLADPFFRYPINEEDLSFIKLKAPIVLFILDQRMTKTDKSFGLSRALPKLFFQALSSDLPNSTLSTSHLQHVCEKVNHNKLDNFFRQWVYGSGVPIFQVTQRFNKKRMVIEVAIKQVQQQETKRQHPHPKNFIRDSIHYLEDEQHYPIQSLFTGPMTIRIHESDGTPYEHIVDLKDSNTKLDIQYNTKYKKLLKRSRTEVHMKEEDNMDIDNDEPVPTVQHNSLGDILTSPEEKSFWNLSEWSKDEEESIANEGFEWIRVDADFEWIGKLDVKQQDPMFAAQLQQDRDVEAQLEAVKFFGDQEKPNSIHCSVLLRTLLDDRYYYGIRVEAARALANFSKEDNAYIGLKYLLKAFKKLFCFEGSDIPLSNDFRDFGKLFLQKEIPHFLSNIRDNQGNVPSEIKSFLLNLLRYNENVNNEFSDSFYLVDVVKSLVNSVLNPLQLSQDHFVLNNDYEIEDPFLNDVLTELNRTQKMDEWIPSYQSMVSTACLVEKVKMARQGLIRMSYEELLHFTQRKYNLEARIVAFEGLFGLGALKNSSVLQYFFKTCLFDSSSYLRTKLIQSFVRAISVAAIYGTPSQLDDDEFDTLNKIIDDSLNSNTKTNMVIVEDGSNFEINSRRDAFARETLYGAIELLRRDYSIGKGLKDCLWQAIHSSTLSVYELRNLFDVCNILYDAGDEINVTIPVPNVPSKDLNKKIVAKWDGDRVVSIKREGRFKIQLTSLKLSRKKSMSEMATPRPILKLSSRDSTAPVIKLSSRAEKSSVEPPVSEVKKETPRIKLKIKDPKASTPAKVPIPAPLVIPAAPTPPTPPTLPAPPTESPKKVAKETPQLKLKPAALFVNKNVRVNKADDRFEVSFKLKVLPTIPVTISSEKRVEIEDETYPLVVVDEGLVTIKLSKEKLSAVKTKSTVILKKLAKSSILKQNPSDPLRYVKIHINKKEILVSSDPFDESSDQSVSAPTIVKKESTNDSVMIDPYSAIPSEVEEFKVKKESKTVDRVVVKSESRSREESSSLSEKTSSESKSKSQSRSYSPIDSESSTISRIPSAPKSMREKSHSPSDFSGSSSQSNSRSSSPFSTGPKEKSIRKKQHNRREEDLMYSNDRRQKVKLNIKSIHPDKPLKNPPPPPKRPSPPPPAPPPSSSSAKPERKKPMIKLKLNRPK